MIPRISTSRAWLMMAFLLAPLPAAAQQFAGDLDPVPHDISTRGNVAGTGSVSADLSGTALHVSGNFAALSSPATTAKLKMGVAMGVPGAAIGELTATHAVNGEISGTVALDQNQIAALKRGALYVELDSAKAPDGNLWGWLENGEGE